jgi:hypothetical protein
MARSPSVILSLAEKKAMVVDLKKAIKAHETNTAAISAEVTKAAKSMTLAEKLADAKKKAVERENSKAVQLAKKQLEATQARTAKMLAAAAKGRSKLDAKLSALESAPVAEVPKVKRGPKPKMDVGVPAPAEPALV